METEAYAPLLRRLAEADLLVVIAKMPFHLAVFDADAAEAIINRKLVRIGILPVILWAVLWLQFCGRPI